MPSSECVHVCVCEKPTTCEFSELDVVMHAVFGIKKYLVCRDSLVYRTFGRHFRQSVMSRMLPAQICLLHAWPMVHLKAPRKTR